MIAVWIWYDRKLPEVDLIPHNSICLRCIIGKIDHRECADMKVNTRVALLHFKYFKLISQLLGTIYCCWMYNNLLKVLQNAFVATTKENKIISRNAYGVIYPFQEFYIYVYDVIYVYNLPARHWTICVSILKNLPDPECLIYLQH